MSGEWDDEGCTASPAANGTVTCKCNHFTNFALLLKVSNRPLDKDKEALLSYITNIGCGISLVGLVLNIIMHSSVRYN